MLIDSNFKIHYALHSVYIKKYKEYNIGYTRILIQKCKIIKYTIICTPGKLSYKNLKD